MSVATSSKPRFWRPGTARPAELPTVVEREPHRETPGIVYNPAAHLSFAQQRRRLPIFDDRSSLLYLVEMYGTVVVVGHTGCGKTTQLPQYLHEAGWTGDGHVVACTQPRRVAATSVAERVAEEMGVMIGSTVGYAVRFDDCFDEVATRIKYMTDGRLIREMMGDPLLTRYSVILVDEAHERSAQTDVLLGLLKKVRRQRPELRLIIASATLEAESFASFFEEHVGCDGQPTDQSATIVTLRGAGVHPVAWHFTEEPLSDYLAHAIDAVMQIHEAGEPGDILLFLTGQQEVEAAVAQINERAAARGKRGSSQLQALPMYAGLPSKAQLAAFEPHPNGFRKVVVATNIAETSITIDGIVHVVDCGFAKQRFTHPSGEEALVIAPISQSSARQRAGRAGRSRPGSYYALMTEAAFGSLALQTPPEMQRCNLASTVLQLKALGVDNVLRFDFLSPPPPQSLASALETLYSLGAIDGTGALTFPRGEAMAMLPLEPQPAAFLLSASAECCEADALTLAALLSLQPPFVALKPADHAIARAPFAVYEGDTITRLNIYHSYQRVKARSGQRKASTWCKKHLLDERVLVRALEVRRQLGKHVAAQARRAKAAGEDLQSVRQGGQQNAQHHGGNGAERIRRALVSGYFANAAEHVGGGTYRSVLRGSYLRLHVNSVLHTAPPDWILFHETTSSGTLELVLCATKVDERWMSELAPHFYKHDQQRHASRGPTSIAMATGTTEMRGAKRSASQRDSEGACTASVSTSTSAATPASFAAQLAESIFKPGSAF